MREPPLPDMIPILMTGQLAVFLSTLPVLLNLLVAMTSFERCCGSSAVGNVGNKVEETGKDCGTLFEHVYSDRRFDVRTKRPGAFAFTHVGWAIFCII